MGTATICSRNALKTEHSDAIQACKNVGAHFQKAAGQTSGEPNGGNRLQSEVKCHDCSFTYIGESKRSWSSRGAEHDPGRASNSESAINPRAWCKQLQQKAFLGIVALHFEQRRSHSLALMFP